jgi:hypothetical protein
MKVNNCELIEKWGFWLALYTFASIIFTFEGSAILSNEIMAAIFIPCFLGGILYVYFGAKFRSAILLGVGASTLLPGAILLRSTLPSVSFILTYFSIPKIYAAVVFPSLFLLIARRSEMTFGKDSTTEKWGIWLTSFAISVSFVACCLYLLVRIFQGNLAKLFTLGLVILIPCLIGGLSYLFLGAKQRSFKYASAGLATLLLGCINVFCLVAISLPFDSMD